MIATRRTARAFDELEKITGYTDDTFLHAVAFSYTHRPGNELYSLPTYTLHSTLQGTVTVSQFKVLFSLLRTVSAVTVYLGC